MARNSTFPVDPGWRPLLKDLGIRSDTLLRRAGLPEELLARPSSGLTTAEYFRFWESLQAEAGDPLLPLRLVEAIQAESFSPPIFAALCSANLLQAGQRISTYKKLIAPMSLTVDVGRDGALTLTPHWLEAQSQVPFVVVASELAFLLRLARLATREPIAALRVTMPQLPAAAPKRVNSARSASANCAQTVAQYRGSPQLSTSNGPCRRCGISWSRTWKTMDGRSWMSSDLYHRSCWALRQIRPIEPVLRNTQKHTVLSHNVYYVKSWKFRECCVSQAFGFVTKRRSSRSGCA